MSMLERCRSGMERHPPAAVLEAPPGAPAAAAAGDARTTDAIRPTGRPRTDPPPMPGAARSRDAAPAGRPRSCPAAHHAVRRASRNRRGPGNVPRSSPVATAVGVAGCEPTTTSSSRMWSGRDRHQHVCCFSCSGRWGAAVSDGLERAWGVAWLPDGYQRDLSQRLLSPPLLPSSPAGVGDHGITPNAPGCRLSTCTQTSWWPIRMGHSTQHYYGAS